MLNIPLADHLPLAYIFINRVMRVNAIYFECTDVRIDFYSSLVRIAIYLYYFFYYFLRFSPFSPATFYHVICSIKEKYYDLLQICQRKHFTYDRSTRSSHCSSNLRFGKRSIDRNHAKNGSQICCHTSRLDTMLLNNSLITFIKFFD